MSEKESRSNEDLEKNPDRIEEIPADKLHPFRDHPFKIRQDEAMDEMIESIKTYGILTPLVARPGEDGEYEIVSGHRRHFAALQAGEDVLPVIVRPMTDDEAVIWMVDSNLQRENVLPSERAFAYKRKMDAIKHQGERADSTSLQIEAKSGQTRSAAIIAEEAGVSRSQVERYIHLTNLIPEVLNLVDEKKIGISPAVEISYLKQEEQKIFLKACDYAQATPSLSQAQRLKKLSQEGNFTLSTASQVLSEVKKGDLEHVTFRTEQLRKYFPKPYTPDQMQAQIIKLLDQWQRKRQRNQRR